MKLYFGNSYFIKLLKIFIEGVNIKVSYVKDVLEFLNNNEKTLKTVRIFGLDLDINEESFKGIKGKPKKHSKCFFHCKEYKN